MSQPKLDAVACYNRGNALQDLGLFDEAIASYDQAIALQPDFARAHYNRGNVLQKLRQHGEALASYDRALALQPNDAAAHYNYGNVLQDLGRHEEAVSSYDRAIALQPDFAEAHKNRGNAFQNLMRFDEAIVCFDKAIAIAPDYAHAHCNKGECLLLTGRLAQGWRQYEWRNVKHEARRRYLRPPWSGEAIAGKTLFIYCEQGIGDSLQFCRYGKLVKALGANVAMSVPDSLFPLLTQMKPDIEIVGYREPPAAFDYRCAMMSLPFTLGTTLATIPEPARIVADQTLRKAWDGQLPPRTKPRIGVVWSGNPEHDNDHNRSIDLATLSPLFSSDAHWISLQKEIRRSDSVLLRGLPHQVEFFGDELTDFSDTAAIIDRLDLVITVDTAVAHLAGTMGKPVWILLPYVPDWRWLLDRDDSPWYPTARLFRQDSTRSWQGVITRVKAALAGAGDLASRQP